MEEDAVQHVQDSGEVCGLKSRCQARGILAITVKYGVWPAKETFLALNRLQGCRRFYRSNGTKQADRLKQNMGAAQEGNTALQVWMQPPSPPTARAALVAAPVGSQGHAALCSLGSPTV